MLLLVLLTLARFRLVQLLANRLVLFVLRPHFQPFIQDSEAALSFDNFAAQIVIGIIHGRDFFIKLLHGSNAVALQKGQQFCVLLEGLNPAGTVAGFVPVDLCLGFV